MCQITVNPERTEDEDLDSGPLPAEPDPVVREQDEKKKKPLRMSLFSPDIVSSMMMISPSKLRRQKLSGMGGMQLGGQMGGGGSGGNTSQGGGK